MNATNKTEQAHNAGQHERNPSRRCKLCWAVASQAQQKIAARPACRRCSNNVDPVDRLGRCEACAEREDS